MVTKSLKKVHKTDLILYLMDSFQFAYERQNHATPNTNNNYHGGGFNTFCGQLDTEGNAGNDGAVTDAIIASRFAFLSKADRTPTCGLLLNTLL
jgi:hypothetical protein